MVNKALYIGIMSGTSMDGIDLVLADINNDTFKLLQTLSYPIPSSLQKKLRQLARNEIKNNEIDQLGECDTELGQLYADATLALLKQSSYYATDIAAIGCHGQTIRHRPTQTHPFTLQIGDANIIAERTGINTINDFRRRDIAAGGQGAPLVPAFHQNLFSSSSESRCIVNIGGIANISFLHQNHCIGFDTGPGNTLLDDWCKQHIHHDYDKDANWSKSGKLQTALLEQWMQDEYVHQAPPKSTGQEKYNANWLKQYSLEQYQAEDIAHTLCAFTAHSIALNIQLYTPECSHIYVCGGGAHNPLIMHYLQQASKRPTQSTNNIGLDPDWVEAAAFAWLAQRSSQQLPGNLASATGAKGPRILGAFHFA